MPLEFALAGVGSRFLALAIDTLIQVSAAVGIVLVVAISAGGAAISELFRQQSVWLIALVVAIIFLLNFGYFAFFEIVWNGQTPGKRKVGVRVIKDSGRPLTAAETLGRNFLRIVDQLPGFYALGVLVALLNSKNKRLGDFIAGSLVVRETPFESVKPVWHTGESAASLVPSSSKSAAAALSLEDLALIETFLHRRHDLAPDVRSRMAWQILDRVKDHLSVAAVALPPEDRGSAESVLESLAHERRASGGYS